MAQKSREEGEIGSESREKGDLPPCSSPRVEGLSERTVWRYYATNNIQRHDSDLTSVDVDNVVASAITVFI